MYHSKEMWNKLKTLTEQVQIVCYSIIKLSIEKKVYKSLLHSSSDLNKSGYFVINKRKAF